MSKPRRFTTYSIGNNTEPLVNVDDMTRDQLLHFINSGLNDRTADNEALRELIYDYTVDLNDMAVGMLRELVKDYADVCDDELKAAV